MVSGADGSQVVTLDGLSVKKRLNEDHPEHVAIIFQISSTRADPVEVRIRDQVPAAAPVGLHPDFGGQHWTIKDEGVEFRRVIEPGETYTTVYGVGNVDEFAVQRLAEEPQVELSAGIESSGSETPGPESDILEQEGAIDADQAIDPDPSTDGAEEFEGAELFSDALLEGPEVAVEHGSETMDADPAEAAAPAETPDTASPTQPEGSGSHPAGVRISDSRIIVDKTLDTEKFSFPAIVFTFTVPSDTPIRATVEDQVPEALSADDIGFHHRYGDDYWDQRDHTVVFDREFEPGEEYTTLYAVRDVDSVPESALLDEPTVTVWQPADSDGSGERIGDSTGDGAATAPETSDGNTAEIEGDRSVAENDTDPESSASAHADDDVDGPASGSSAPSGSGTAGGTEEDGTTGELDLESLLESSEATTEGDGRTVADSGGSPEPTSSGEESDPTPPVPDIGTQTEHPEGPEALDSSPEPNHESRQATPRSWISGSLKQKIDDLETILANLDESPPGDEIASTGVQAELERVQEGIAELQTSLEALEERTDSMPSAIETIDESIEGLQQSITELQESRAADISELDETLSDLLEEVSLIKSTLASDLDTTDQLRSHLEELGSEIQAANDAAKTSGERTASLAEDLTRVETMLESNAERLDELGTNQDALRDAIESMNDQVIGMGDLLQEIDATISDYGSEIDRLKQAMIADLSVRNPSEVGELPVAERELLQAADAVPLTLISGIGRARSKALESKLGISTMADLAEAHPESVASTLDLSLEEARRTVNTAQALNSL